MSDDELRGRITKALSDFEVFTAGDGHPSIRMKHPWTDKEQVNALMPVVREALADAWDVGNAAGWSDGGDANCAGLLPEDEHHNPWREDN